MKNIKVRLKVVHSIPGRARIKIESTLDPKVFFFVLEAGLKQMPAIKKAELNPHSQSITFFFNKNLKLALILKELEQVLSDVTNDPDFFKRLEDIRDILTYGNKDHMEVSIRNSILTVSQNLDTAVKHMTGNIVDLRTAVPITSFASGVGLLFLAPGLPTPTWLVLLTFGITSFHILKHDHGKAESTADHLCAKNVVTGHPNLLEEATSSQPENLQPKDGVTDFA